VVAGSETTATALSGAAYHLGIHQDVQAKLAAEVRSTFASESEIDIYSVQKLPYMLAVLEETMRMYPPAPTALPRVTPAEGATICGQYLPGNVRQLIRLRMTSGNTELTSLF